MVLFCGVFWEYLVFLREANMTQEEKDLAVMKRDGYALEFVRVQSQEICLVAVKQDGRALEFVQGCFLRECLVFLRGNGWST